MLVGMDVGCPLEKISGFFRGSRERYNLSEHPI
jgi:hypothetical protein